MARNLWPGIITGSQSILPLTRISRRRGKPAAHRKAIRDGLYRAMRETFNVPEVDRFMLLTEHDEVDFDYGATYLGIVRSDDLVLMQLTVNNTRSLAQKKALYRRIVALPTESPGLRPEVSSSTWSRCCSRTRP
jgi:4-oxalocrotonate tautomerase